MSAQMDYVNHIVIGIGINVHNESFPEEIAPVATSLYMETGEHFNRAALIEEVWEQFEHYYAIFMETEDLSGLVKEYDTHLINRNQIVKVLDPKEPFYGKAMGITPKGELIVDTWEAEDLYLQEKSLCAVSTDMCKDTVQTVSVETVWKGMSEWKKWYCAVRAHTIKILSERGL